MKYLQLLVTITLFTSLSCKEEPVNTKVAGQVFGTTYAVIYEGDTNYEIQFDSLFYVINASLSTYQSNSIVSKINRGETTPLDDHFITVFNASKAIYESTNGVFDPTIGAVVNAWDFGPEGKIVALDSMMIDSLMQGVGFSKLIMNKKAFKLPENTFLDFNAIAKGYGVDVIADFLESENVQNYLVEIGGEIRIKGINIEKQLPWTVGIDKPNFDGSQSVMKAISLNDVGMATSGTYRKFKLDENGNRYAHIINTKTGYPTTTNILSVSVLANDCMTADAYATAFQAMGIEAVTTFLISHPELKLFIIYENDANQLETLALNGFPVN